ncbi:sensor histidine kinase [Micromonospora mirobrigensis]|uniref:histidine kinase n=1 Tax=Micromonospora mirobrigensis TaxID=262898 RepID=A0A1C4XN17_9ACTN|nr:histidine kinase [Micromonospora mirobrigensis]SCF09885.1 Signal transduction histidine kinase [Micromonospora mirobrigensis]
MRGLRGWWPELLLGLVATLLGLASGVNSVLGAESAGRHAALAVAAGLALVGVRRRPWVVLVLETLLMLVAVEVAPFGTGTPVLCGAVALGFVAYRSGWSSTGAAFAVYLAAVIGTVVRSAVPGVLTGGAGVLRLTTLVAATAAPVAFGRYLGGLRNAAAVAEERAREAEARQEMQTRSARLAERASIARDLHDIVAHHVAAIALQAGASQYAIRQTGRVDDAVTAFGELRTTAARVLDELRELLEVLRDPEAVEGGAPMVEPEQIITEAQRLVRAAGLSVQVTVDHRAATTPLVVRTTAARVIQEGLTNSLKHAGAGAIATAVVRLEPPGLLVEVLDSGPAGPRPEATLPSSGHGLTGMRERVGLLGGTLTAGPTAAGGWRLRARLPVREVVC